MKIQDDIRDCVAFVMYAVKGDLKLAGTAFFVSDGECNYVVTARHVIEEIGKRDTDGELYLRINTVDGGISKLLTKIDDWAFHPTDPSVDVAVMYWPMIENLDFEHRTIKLSETVTPALIQELDIGLGDEVFTIGLFSKHVGKQRNIPIARVGNIAAMPQELVTTKMGDIEAFLIEAKSVGGLSGSPVFIYLDKRIEGKKYRIPHLLGLMHGHWNVSSMELDKVAQDDLAGEPLNTGISVVVPSSKILEVLSQKGLNSWRTRAAEEMRQMFLEVYDRNPNVAPDGLTVEEWAKRVESIRKMTAEQYEEFCRQLPKEISSEALAQFKEKSGSIVNSWVQGRRNHQ